MEISSLYAKLGFIVDDKGVEKFKEKLNSIKKAVSSSEIKGSLDSLKIEEKKLKIEKERAQIKKIEADTEYKHQKKLIDAAKEERLKEKEERLQKKSFLQQRLGAMARLAAIAQTIRKAAYPSMSFGTSLENFSYQTGLDSSMLKALQSSMQRSGSQLTREDVTAMVKELQQKMISIRLGTGNIEPFTMLGVSAYGQNPFRVLEDISKSIKNIDNATASNALSQLGLGHPDMIRMLRGELQGSALGQLVLLTKGEQKTLADMNVGWRKLTAATENFRDKFIAKFDYVPLILEKIADAIDAINVVLSPIFEAIQNAIGVIVGTTTGILEGTIGSIAEIISGWWGGKGEESGGEPSTWQKIKNMFGNKKPSYSLPEAPLWMNENDVIAHTDFYMDKAMEDKVVTSQEYNAIKNYIVNMQKNPDLSDQVTEALEHLSLWSDDNSTYINSNGNVM